MVYKYGLDCKWNVNPKFNGFNGFNGFYGFYGFYGFKREGAALL